MHKPKNIKFSIDMLSIEHSVYICVYMYIYIYIYMNYVTMSILFTYI